MLTLSTGNVTTLVGSNPAVISSPESGFVDGNTSTSLFNLPTGIANHPQDPSKFYVSDTENNAIRELQYFSSNGSATTTTIAGIGGLYGYSDGNTTVSQFKRPRGL